MKTRAVFDEDSFELKTVTNKVLGLQASVRPIEELSRRSLFSLNSRLHFRPSRNAARQGPAAERVQELRPRHEQQVVRSCLSVRCLDDVGRTPPCFLLTLLSPCRISQALRFLRELGFLPLHPTPPPRVLQGDPDARGRSWCAARILACMNASSPAYTKFHVS